MRIWMLLTLLGAWNLYAQEFSPAPFLGMGKATVAQTGLYAIVTNPAGLQAVQGLEIAIAYQQHFLKADIATQGILVALPLAQSSRIGIALTKYGLKDVNSLLRAGISWNRSFGNQLSASTTINYHQYYVRGYRLERAVSADLGFQYSISATLRTGVFFKNIGNNSFPTAASPPLSRQIGMGFSYAFSEELLIAVDFVKTFPHQLLYRVGMSYSPHPKIVLRVGSLSNPIQYTAGMGVKYKKWQFEWANLFHVKLGSSPQFMMAYAF